MFHANGWTFTWTVTAAAGDARLPAQGRPGGHLRPDHGTSTSGGCAPRPPCCISLANAPPEVRGEVPAGVRVITAGAPPAAATIERLEGELGWEVTHVYGLTETAPFITVCAPLPEHEALAPADRAVIKARQGVELLTSGELRVVDEEGTEVPADGRDARRDHRARQRRDAGVLQRPRGNRAGDGRRLVPHRRRRRRPPGRLRGDPRPHQGRDHQRRREHLVGRGRGGTAAPSRRGRGGDRRAAERAVGRVARTRSWSCAREPAQPRTSCGSSLRDRLAHFKVPHGVTFVAELPKTATGQDPEVRAARRCRQRLPAVTRQSLFACRFTAMHLPVYRHAAFICAF